MLCGLAEGTSQDQVAGGPGGPVTVGTCGWTAESGLTSQPLQPLLPPPSPHHQQECKQQQDTHQDAGDGHQHLEPLVGCEPFFTLDNGLNERRDCT